MRKVIFLLICLSFIVSANAQSILTKYPQTNNTVSAIAMKGDTAFIGGNFTKAGIIGQFAAPLDANGKLPAGFPQPNGTVSVCISDKAGGWYVGGNFTYVGGLPRQNLAHITSDGKVDPLFKGYAFSSTIISLCLNGNRLYAGGNFTTLGVNTGRAAMIDAGTGQIITSFPNINGTVNVLLEDGNGGWYVGGLFTLVGSARRTNIARVNADGSVSDWNPTANNTVGCLALSGNTLYAGGTFTSLGGAARNRAGAVSTITGLATSWNPNANSTLTSIAVSAGTVYLGGSFTTVGGITRARLAAVDAITGALGSFNPSPNNTVFAIAVSGDTLFLGGSFTVIGGQSRTNLASYQISTGTLTNWAPNPNSNVRALYITGNTLYVVGTFTSINAVARGAGASFTMTGGTNPTITSWNPNSATVILSVRATNTQVFLGGSFVTVNGQTRNRFAVVNNTTGALLSINPSMTSNVNAIALGNNNTVVIGGAFIGSSSIDRNRLACMDAASGSLTSWNPNVNSTVSAIAVSGNTVYIGGSFTTVGVSNTRNRAAAIDATTGLVTTWNPNADNSVTAITIASSGIYVGGSFTNIGGLARNRIAAFDPVTGLVKTWNPNASNTVNAIVISGNTVYLGGGFTNIGGTIRNFIAAVDATTAVATSWNPTANSSVLALSVANGFVYAGGGFSTMGGISRLRLAAIDISSGVVNAWDPQPNTTVNSIATYNGAVYVGGAFTRVGGETRNRLAAFSITSGQLLNWNPNANNTVSAISVKDNIVYVGGSFTLAGGQTRNRIAALDAFTGLATSWNPNANNLITSIAISGSTVYAGGTFTSIGGQTRNRIAALDANGFATSWNPSASSTVSVLCVKGDSLYIGGAFTVIGGSTRNFVAAFKISTGTLTGINPIANSTVNSLSVKGDTLFLGGGFTTLGGQTRNRIAAYTISGNVLNSWYPAGGANSTLTGISLNGNNLYVGGSFTTMGGATRNRAASIDVNTGVVTAWDANPNNTVNVVNGVSEVVFMGGAFTTVQTQSYTNFVGMTNCTSAVEPTLNYVTPACANGTLQLKANTIANASYRWYGPNGFTSNDQNPVISNVTTAYTGDYYCYTIINGCVSNSATVNVEIAGGTVIASSNQPCAGQNLELFASANNGATYQWTGPNSFTSTEQNPVVNNIQANGAGTYTVTATIAGCAASANATIITLASPAPVIDPASPISICSGSNVVLDAGAGYSSYIWSNGSTTRTITVNTAATYSVTVVQAGCTSLPASAQVNTSAPVVISQQPVSQTACSGTSATFQVVATGGASYQWFFNANALEDGGNISGSNAATLSINPTDLTQAGNYYCLITNENCANVVTSTVSLTVTQVTQITSQPVLSNAVCQGNNAVFSVTATGTNLSYQWYNNGVALTNSAHITGATTNQLTIVAATQADESNHYYCIISNTGSCSPAISTIHSTLVMNEIPGLLNSLTNQVLCTGNSIDITADSKGENLTYQWRRGGANLVDNSSVSGVNLATLTFNNVGVTDGGSYDIVITNECGSYTSPAFTVTINQSPSVSAGTDQTICEGSTITLNASGATSYVWNPGNISGASVTVSPAFTTEYTVTGTSNGCSKSDVVIITVLSKPSAPEIDGTASVCTGNTATIFVNVDEESGDPGTFQWFTVPSGGSPFFTGTSFTSPALTSNTTYYIQQFLNTCASDRVPFTVTVTAYPLAAITPDGPTTFCGNSGVKLAATAGAGYTYEWYYGASPLGYTAQVLFANVPGSYSVKVSNSSGCATMSAPVSLVSNPVPNVAITGATTVCVGDVLQLSATPSGLSYSWTGPNSFTSASQSISVPGMTFLQSGVYQVTGTAANGCGQTASIFVGYSSISTGMSVTGGGSYCANGSGVPVGLSYSETGVNYQLLRNGINVGAPVAGNFPDPISFGNQTLAGTYTVKGTSAATGCSAMTTGSVTVVTDNTPPAANCKNITVQLSAGHTAIVIATDINNNSTDNCGIVNYAIISGKTSYSCSDVGQTFPVTLQVTDAAGLASTCTASVTVRDDVNPCCAAPVAKCKTITLPLGPNGTATLTPQMVDNGSTAGCGLQSMIVSKTTFTCADIVQSTITVTPIPVTLTVTDINGVSSGCTAIVNLTDVTAPVIAVPGDFTVYNDPGMCGAVINYNVTATDNCTMGSLTRIQGLASGTLFPVGQTTVTYQALDWESNTSTASFTVTVVDNEVPVISCQPKTVYLGSHGPSGVADATISGIINQYAAVTTAGTNSVSVTSAAGFTAGNKVLIIQMKGATIDLNNAATFGDITAINNTGNYEYARISSISSNNISFVSGLTRSYDVAGKVQIVKVPEYNNVNITGTLIGADWNGSTGGVLAFDAAGVVTMNANIDMTGKGFVGGLRSLNYYIGCPNHTQYFFPQPAGEGGQKGEGIADAGTAKGAGRGKQGNGGGGGNDVNSGGAGGSSYGIGGNGAREWSGCNNDLGGKGGAALSSFINQNKLFLGGGGGGGQQNDNGGTDGVDGGGIIMINAAQLNGNNRQIIAKGNSQGSSGGDGGGGGGAGGAIIFNVPVVNSAVTVNAGGGNGSLASGHGGGGGGAGGVVWFGTASTPANVATVISGGSAPGDQSPQPGGTGGLLYNLQVPGVTSITYSKITVSDLTTNSDNCGIAGVTISIDSFTCAHLGDNPVTITVTDVNGLSSTCTTIVTVKDTTRPVISAPANITVNTDLNQCFATGVNPGTPVTYDNCSVASAVNDAPASFPKGVTTVTWTVTDGSGNTATAVQTVTVVDAQAPLLTPAANQNVNLNGSCFVTIPDVRGIATDNCPGVVVTQSPAIGTAVNSSHNGTVSVTVTATDAIGLTTIRTVVLTAKDVTPPSITCPANISVFATGASGAAVTYSAPLGTDNCSGATTVRTAGLASGATFPIGITTVTYTVTDAAGLSSSCSFTVTVSGLAPVISCPANITVNNTPGQCGASVSFSATESTGIPASAITYSHQPGNSFPVGTTTVTATSANAVGSSSCTFTITVVDDQPPVINGLPGNTNKTNDIDKCGAVATWTAPTVSDNCPGATIVQIAGPASGTLFPVGTTTVSYKASDASGNAVTQSFTITVTDNQAPVFGKTVSKVAVLGSNSASITTYLNANGFTATNFNSSIPSAAVLAGFDAVVLSRIAGNATVDNFVRSGNLLVTEWDASAWALNTAHLLNATDAGGGFIGTSTPVTFSNNTLGNLLSTGLGNPYSNTGATEYFRTLSSIGSGVTILGTRPTNIPAILGGQSGTGYTLIMGYDWQDIFPASSSPSGILLKNALKLPVLTSCSPDITVNATGNCSAVVNYSVPVPLDNCPGATVTLKAGFAPGSSFPLGTTVVSYEATDASGNKATCSFNVTVVDVTPPSITCPSNINAIATSAAGTAVSYTAPVGTDNCPGVTTTRIAGFASGATFPIGTTTVTYRATDVAGNTSTCSFTVTVVGVPPSIVCPANIVVSNTAGQCGTTVGFNATETTAIPPSVITYSHQPGSFFPVGTTTVTATATNAVGISSCTFTITVNDTEVPILAGVPSDVTVECDAVPKISNVTATDNCPGAGDVLYSELRTDGNCPNSYTLTRTWTVTDAHGNTSSATQVIIVRDTQAPTITTSAADLTVECDGGGNEGDLAQWLSSHGGAAASDACGTITWSHNFTALSDDCGRTGSATVIFTATDACGNASGTTATFTIVDRTAPVITCPSDATVSCEDNTSTAALGVATARDICSAITITHSDVSTQNADANNAGHYNYTITRTWKAVDDCGNASECLQAITVRDVAAPVITCPANITVSNALNVCGATVNYTLPTATDICGGIANATSWILNNISFVDGGTASGSFEYNTLANTISNWSISVTGGNTAFPAFTYTPSNSTVSSNPDGKGVTFRMNSSQRQFRISTLLPKTNAGGTLTLNIAGSPSGNTECFNCSPFRSITSGSITGTGGGLTMVQTAGLPRGSVFPVGTTTNTFIATDASDNTVTCSFTVTVNDTEKPKLNGVPSNSNRQCNAVPPPPNVTATDNCPGVGPVQFSETRVDGSCPSSYTLVRKWTVTDAHGNVTTETRELTVIDTQAPTITKQASGLTVECNGAGNTTDLNAWLNTNGGATATDACTIVTWSNNFTGLSDLCGLTGSATVIFRATDACGNSRTTTATFTIVDNTAPVITCPADATVNCQDDTSPAALGSATGSDVCSGVTITSSDVSTQNADLNNAGHYNYTIKRTWTATDECGNSTNCVQAITVHDVTAPVITCPANTTVNCQDDNTSASNGKATATDNCAPVTITESDVSAQNADVNNAGHYNYTITRTWRATDVSGNYSECTQTITVHDVTAPVITCPASTTVNCQDDNTSASNGKATVTDNCAPVTITESDASTQNADVNNAGHYNYTITRTWRATDVSGNYSECVQTITVRDITNPVITCPANTTVNCQDDNTSASNGKATATDNCAPVTITESDASTQNADVNNAGHYNYTITRTWRATDVSGNYSECTQTITVHDVTAPVITCPASTTVNCQDDNTSASNGKATATDNCAPVTITESDASTQNADVNNAGHYNYTITRTWRATDVSGNYSECTQTITVHDVTAPSVSCPADVTVNCQDNNTSSATGVATGSDICSPVTITQSQASTRNSNPGNPGYYNYKITRTWKATDVSGNYSTCTQTIKVQDVTAPTAKCQNVTITLVNGSASITTAMIDNGSTDNCSPLAFSLSKSTFNCSNLGANTVTLTVKDVSGNTSTCTATVTVVGEIPTCSIASVPTDATYTGGVSTNLYLGYGAQSTKLQLSVPASGAPYTFQWSGNGTLSSTTVQSPLFAPTAAGNYTFTVFITNKYGCTTTCTISICVMDIRSLSSNGTWDGKKVYICHVPPGNPGNANTLEVSVNAVPAHIGPLGHATDRLGKCTQTPCSNPISKAPVATVETPKEALSVILSPNPTSSQFALEVISSDKKTPVTIRIMDRLGRVVETRKGTAYDIYRFGSNYINGTYFVEVMQGEHKKVVQGVKAN
jgi:hypothetical protein